MFDQYGKGRARGLPRYAVISIGVHAVVVAGLLLLASFKSGEPDKKAVEVSFMGPGKGKGAPPPPPPPPAKKHSSTPRRKVVLAKVEIPRPQIVQPKVVEPVKEEPPKKEEEDDEPDEPGAQEGGVAGGVAGGVVGGVVGGQVGGTGGGGSLVPERPRAKNVPPFVIQRDMIRQAPPRMSEMFKASHRGQQVNGMYKVCVDTDGHVYEVTPLKPIDGANEEIIEGIKADWLYKPQPVPVCFMHPFLVTIQN